MICSTTTEDASLLPCSASVACSLAIGSCGFSAIVVVAGVAVEVCSSANDKDVSSKQKAKKNMEIWRFTCLKNAVQR